MTPLIVEEATPSVRHFKLRVLKESSAATSSSVTVEDRRSYIRIEPLSGKTGQTDATS